MANASAPSCPTPFLALDAYPPTGGFVKGRLCAEALGLTCCVPCPSEDWIFSDRFMADTPAAFWAAIAPLVMNLLLLITFIVLPTEYSHRHYLSVGLSLSLVVLYMVFVVPLGADEHRCWDAITPKNESSSLACAWSGACIVWGGMAVDVWVLIRSFWTHLRVVWNVKQRPYFFWISQVVGWGLPTSFLAVLMPITGVSYRLGLACVPNIQNVYLTWLGWLIAFACLGGLLQISTTLFCLWLFIRESMKSKSKHASYNSSAGRSFAGNGPTTGSSSVATSDRGLSWYRVRQILQLQWRSILLSLLVIFACVFFAIPFLQTNIDPTALTTAQTTKLTTWEVCMVYWGGDKSKCASLAGQLGINENLLIAAVFFVALVGTLVVGLMFRVSMLHGWWRLIRYQTRRPSIGEDFFIASPQRKSFGRPLESEKMQHKIDNATDAEPVSPGVPRQNPNAITTIPEAGDVSTRHETIDWFDEEYEEREKERKRRSRVDAGAA